MGKDTVADYMVEWLANMRPALKVKKIPLAWKLKDVCHQLYGHLGLREAEFYDTPEGAALRDQVLLGINKTPVEIWIDMGTSAVREKVWDDTWVEWLKSRTEYYDVIIAPDVRFPNELPACDCTIKVVNPRVPNRIGKSVDDILADADWDHTIINDLGYSELRGQANVLIERIIKS